MVKTALMFSPENISDDVKMVRHCGNFDLTAHVGDYIIHYDDGTIDFLDADTFNNYFERI